MAKTTAHKQPKPIRQFTNGQVTVMTATAKPVRPGKLGRPGIVVSQDGPWVKITTVISTGEAATVGGRHDYLQPVTLVIREQD